MWKDIAYHLRYRKIAHYVTVCFIAFLTGNHLLLVICSFKYYYDLKNNVLVILGSRSFCLTFLKSSNDIPFPVRRLYKGIILL